MDKVPEDKAKGLPTPIWTKYQIILDTAAEKQVCLNRNSLEGIHSYGVDYVVGHHVIWYNA